MGRARYLIATRVDAETLKTRVTHARPMEAAMANEYEVIIIGSGVAGALCAWKLIQDTHNCKILILKAGDNEIPHGQLIEFHHTMNAQGNRGDMYAPYRDLEADSSPRSRKRRRGSSRTREMIRRTITNIPT